MTCNILHGTHGALLVSLLVRSLVNLFVCVCASSCAIALHMYYDARALTICIAPLTANWTIQNNTTVNYGRTICVYDKRLWGHKRYLPSPHSNTNNNDEQNKSNLFRLQHRINVAVCIETYLTGVYNTFSRATRFVFSGVFCSGLFCIWVDMCISRTGRTTAVVPCRDFFFNCLRSLTYHMRWQWNSQTHWYRAVTRSPLFIVQIKCHTLHLTF